MLGPITWLALNEKHLSRIRYGLVLALLGRPGEFVYKRTRRGNTATDKVLEHALGRSAEVRDFDPYGYDERQYCSPGFDLPVGRLTRTPHAEFAEYHSSADDLSLIAPDALAGALETLTSVVAIMDGDARYVNLSPKGEPQLGRRGLYSSVGGAGAGDRELALLWVLSLSDGDHSLLDVAERADLPFPAVREAADALLERELLAPA